MEQTSEYIKKPKNVYCTNFYKRVEQFKNSCDSVTDEHSSGRVMLMVYWDTEGSVFCDYLEERRTINSQYYSDLLLSKAKPAIREKHSGSQRKDEIL